MVSYFGRIFARSGGLSDAVAQGLKEQNIEFDLKAIPSIEELRKEECNIFITCKETMETIRKINHPNLTLLVDYYHAMLGGDTFEEIASYKDKITHVHIASPLHGRHVPMPDDGEDYQGFFDALKKADYKAMNISLEGNFGGKDPVEIAKTSFEYLKKFN